ncbi:hypothetical protein ACFRR7_35305 [Streptomyces sp. NPDC056909]|uniref:hypothetical protein n=1 Tax=Streptomyces sp. NPDC056909 TaxID=3345963 RepID=UPI0036BB33FC
MALKLSDFYREAEEVFVEVVADLGLSVLGASGTVLPVYAFGGQGFRCEVGFDTQEADVECRVKILAQFSVLTASIEEIAITAGVVGGRGGLSYSARNAKQLRNSLAGQARYVRLVHPFLIESEAEDLLRRAGAREWVRERGE